MNDNLEMTDNATNEVMDIVRETLGVKIDSDLDDILYTRIHFAIGNYLN